MRNVLLLLSALLASAVAQAQTESPRTLPYEETFDTAEAGNTYTIVNADNDNYLWKYNAAKKTMGYTGGIGTANDWLITPALSLEADKTYRVNFDTWLDAAWSESAYKHIEVAYGQGEDPSTYTVVQDFHITSASTTDATKEITITVTQSGEWRIGFHCHDKADYNRVNIDNVKVAEDVVVPAAVSDLTATPGENGALSVALAWTNPSTTSTGDALSALDSVEVYRGDALIQTIKTPTMGEAATYTDAALTEAGIYTYTVTAYAAGQSAKDSVKTAWVGEDVPTAVTNLQATAEGDVVTLSFTATTSTVHNGWIDPTSIRYRITRLPDNEVVAETYEYTAPFTDQVPQQGTYSYTVTSLNSTGAEGESVTSNEVTAGPAIKPPYHETLETQEGADQITVLNANNDEYTWTYFNLMAAFYYKGGSEANDYLFTPGLSLQAGVKYRFSLDAWLSQAATEADYRRLQMTIGSSMTAEAHTTILLDSLIKTVMPTTYSTEFTVDETGVWYLGIHCTGAIGNTTEVDVSNLAVDVVEGGSTGLQTPTTDGLQAWSYQGTLTIEAATARTAQLYAIDGRLLRTLHLAAGRNTVDGLQPGLYLLDQQKVVIK